MNDQQPECIQARLRMLDFNDLSLETLASCSSSVNVNFSSHGSNSTNELLIQSYCSADIDGKYFSRFDNKLFK